MIGEQLIRHEHQAMQNFYLQQGEEGQCLTLVYVLFAGACC